MGLRLVFGVLIAGLAVLPSAGCQFFRDEELVCTGTVTFGQETLSDKLILKVLHREIRVSGQTGKTSTFEAGLPYKICSESQNQLDFEFSTNVECGKKDVAPRYGHLNKALGNLRMSRLLSEQTMVGDYKCGTGERVLN